MADKNLTVKIKGDNANLSRSLRQSKAGISKFGGFLKGFGAKFGVIGGALVGTASVAGGVRIFTQASADVDRLAKLGKNFGLTTEEVQKFERVAKLTGVELDVLLDGFGNLSKSIVTFVRDGTGPGKAVFAELGLSADDLSAAFAKGPVAILAKFGQALQKIENPIKRAALVEEVLGTTNKKLGVVLADVAGIFRDVDRTFKKANLGLTPEEVQSVEDYNDAWTRVFNTLDNKVRKFAASVVGDLEPAVDRLNTTLENFFAGDLKPETLAASIRDAGAGAKKAFSLALPIPGTGQAVQGGFELAALAAEGGLSFDRVRAFFARGIAGGFDTFEIPPTFSAKIVQAVRGSNLEEVLPGLSAPRPGTGTINGRRISDIMADIQSQLGQVPPFGGIGGLPPAGTGTINGRSIEGILKESQKQTTALDKLNTTVEKGNFFRNERTDVTTAVAAP